MTMFFRLLQGLFLIAAASAASIPRVFHQTWKSRTLPPLWEKWRQTCVALHPGWRWKLWTDEDNRALVERHNPSFLPTYDAYPDDVMRIDVARYYYLFYHGGVYMDTDFACLKKLGPLLRRGVPTFGKQFPKKERREGGDVVTNAFMAAPKGHALFRAAIDGLAAVAHLAPTEGVHVSTGSGYLSKLIPRFSDARVLGFGRLVTHTWRETRHPCQLARKTLDFAECRRRVSDRAYTTTFWNGSWMKPFERKALARQLERARRGGASDGSMDEKRRYDEEDDVDNEDEDDLSAIDLFADEIMVDDDDDDDDNNDNFEEELWDRHDGDGDAHEDSDGGGLAVDCMMRDNVYVNCGYPGIGRAECEAKGCCYNEDSPVHACYPRHHLESFWGADVTGAYGGDRNLPGPDGHGGGGDRHLGGGGDASHWHDTSHYGHNNQPPPPRHHQSDRIAGGGGLSGVLAADLSAFYAQYAPEKAGDAARIAQKYRGRRDALVKKLSRKYGADAARWWRKRKRKRKATRPKTKTKTKKGNAARARARAARARAKAAAAAQALAEAEAEAAEAEAAAEDCDADEEWD